MGENPNTLNGRLRRLLLEYLKDSNRSDKQIARVLGVSQSTVSRLKTKLITEGILKHFSAIPDFAKIGYAIMAFSCVKFKQENIEEIEARVVGRARRNHEILFTSRTQGMGMDALTISVHKNYVNYANFIEKNKEMFGDLIADPHNILIDLKGHVAKPFSLKYLAEEPEKWLINKYLLYLWLFVVWAKKREDKFLPFMVFDISYLNSIT